MVVGNAATMQFLAEGSAESVGVQDTAGGKVQDTSRGSGPLDLFGGSDTGKSPQSKAEGLVKEAEKPNPAGSFLGGLIGIDEKKTQARLRLARMVWVEW